MKNDNKSNMWEQFENSLTNRITQDESEPENESAELENESAELENESADITEDRGKSYDVNDIAETIKTNDHSPIPANLLGITTDDISNESSEKENEKTDTSGKTNFNALTQKKTLFKPGKLNKQRILTVLAVFLIGTIVFFNIAFSKTKEEEESIAQTENIDTYAMPNFGDYNERGYQNNEEEIQKIEKILNPENPTPFIKETVQPTQPTVRPTYIPPEPVFNERTYGAMVSKLKLEGAGFGDDIPNGVNSMIQGGIPNIASPVLSKDEYVESQLNTLDTVLSSIGLNSNNSGGGSSSNNESGSSNGAFQFNNTEGGAITPLQSNTLYPGTIIPAALISGINTDYPAGITARVISPVYDSRTGNTLLIPAGSILRGGYSSSSFGVDRVQIAWTELIINRDGIDYMVSLGSMAGVDAQGQAGIKGSIDEHFFEYLKAAGIMSVFSVLNSELFYYSDQFSQQTGNSAFSENTGIILDGTQGIINDLGNKMLDRALDIQPTVTVKNGTRVSVEVNMPLTLMPLEKDEVKERYNRR